MTLEEFTTWLNTQSAVLYWLAQRDPRQPYHPEVQRAILAEGEWVVKIRSRIPKLGKGEGRSADGSGRTLNEAFANTIEAWNNPFIWKPRAKPLRLMDLDLEIEL